ncbi:hypothetical protein OWM54_23715 [Myxococcus sp. MISCRS1]|jgi:hypothetical protein|uniref:hypothetical protein n=1 Tax=Myxococcus TaxID=32 RepID=UPI001CC0574A|nr:MULTISPECIES: hypothetical protein [Myxococcus]MBZ4398485.1 hypothetical protein [Myxococcus sp. AS-1-15]MCK8502016.1 hypothetical protein [Myxococcus fulvus]MCY1000151.1 hypothetical protein [Myxococcus sp. MISCRS1]BDT38298.1 cupin domain-containing protein [Myxococcus sp. MH1]
MESKQVTVRRWSELSNQPLSEESVRALHLPAKKYRVSVDRYSSVEDFGGSMRAGTVYVLAGHCQMEFGTQAVQFAAGDVAEFPEGSYRVVVNHEAGCVVVFAWELPAEFAR